MAVVVISSAVGVVPSLGALGHNSRVVRLAVDAGQVAVVVVAAVVARILPTHLLIDAEVFSGEELEHGVGPSTRRYSGATSQPVVATSKCGLNAERSVFIAAIAHDIPC